jgi:type VI secretion system protein ImpH
MSTPQRRQPAGVIARLLAEPHRFGFFQAVRLLNRWFARRDRRTGSSVLTPRLRFRNTLSLSFPASEIAEFTVVGVAPPASQVDEASPEGAQVAAEALGPHPDRRRVSVAAGARSAIEAIEMTPAFMSLLGASGALPIFYTELLAERETYHRDTAARAFLDIFQHRAVTLFYEAWRKHRLPIQYEGNQRSQFLPLVLAVAGVGQKALRDRLHGDEGGVSDDTVAYFAGLLQQRPVSARAIEQVVSEYFAVTARVEQFVGRWFNLPPDCSSSLGAANVTLGADAVMGERVWQRDLRMRLTLGPMRRDKLRRFLPGGAAAPALRDLLSMMTGVTLEYELRLALRADEVRGTTLSDGADGVSLGWDSYLVTQPVAHDRSDAGYDIHALH